MIRATGYGSVVQVEIGEKVREYVSTWADMVRIVLLDLTRVWRPGL